VGITTLPSSNPFTFEAPVTLGTFAVVVANMNTIIGAVQAGLMGNDAIPKPRFILEVFPDFQIRDTNDRAVAQDLERLGFGIISYTWGRFQDKTTYEESLDAPKFDEVDKDGLPDRIRWYIPKLRNGAFTIKDVRGIIQRLNMKYVWWYASLVAARQ
jgi:hypothetical protein